jgi:cephalosporin hydroxylase
MLKGPRQRAKMLLQSIRLPKQGSIIEKFNYVYYHGTGGVTPFSTTTWFGVKALKCSTDAWIYQELLYRTQPDVIIECGVRHGGGALYLAHLCDLIGKGEILGVDITLRLVHEKVRAHPRITLFEGSSTEPNIVEEVRKRCEGKKTMVILDSDHSETHVANELRAYAPMVSKGCYLIVEDGIVNGHPAHPKHGPGPYEATQSFLKQNDGWKVDKECERLLLTFNPSGYLLRI